MSEIRETQRILGAAKQKLNEVPLEAISENLGIVDTREVVADIEAFNARMLPRGEESGELMPLGKLYGLGTVITNNVEHATNLFIHTAGSVGSTEVLSALAVASAMKPKAEELNRSTDAVYEHTLEGMKHLAKALQSFADAEEARGVAIEAVNELYNMRIDAIGGIDRLRDELL